MILQRKIDPRYILGGRKNPLKKHFTVVQINSPNFTLGDFFPKKTLKIMCIRNYARREN
jgi:hypothetical protein